MRKCADDSQYFAFLPKVTPLTIFEITIYFNDSLNTYCVFLLSDPILISDLYFFD